MKSSIGTFVLRFAVTVVLFAPDGFARDPNLISLCPPSLRMTEQDGCQLSNGLKSGILSAPIKDDAAEQWNQIVSLIKNTSLEVQSCVWRGPLRSGWTLDGANAELSRCQREVEVSNLIRSIPSPEVRSCVWMGPLRNQLTLDTAATEISRCQNQLREQKLEHQRKVDEFWEQEPEHQRNINAELLLVCIVSIFASVALLALTIRFRVKIAARVYNLFVGCLALRLRFNRFRKRFVDNAIKEAENRLG